MELMLWRHAKARLAAVGEDDFDRALAPRGERAAQAVARWLTTRHLAPDRILCSPARRTRQTVAHLLAELLTPPPIVHDPALYLAEAETLLRLLRALPGPAGRVLLVGHNDGIAHLARHLASDGPADRIASLRAKFPTGALAWLKFPGDSWASLGNDGTLLHFVRPRDIVEDSQ